VLRLVGLQRGGIPQFLPPLIGLQKVLLDTLALLTLDLTSGILIRNLINNTVKLVTINRVTQQPNFDPLLVFFPEFAEKIVF